jgi:hypothetical protein
MRATSADGAGIDFETAGHGEPLVLLHGSFGDRTCSRCSTLSALTRPPSGDLPWAAVSACICSPLTRGASPPSSRVALMLSPSVPIPAEVEREAELFRTEGTAPFITWLERQGRVPSWLREATLAGDQDPRLPAIERTATRIPSTTLVRLPDCGHLDTFARTDLTLPVVLPFLSEHPGHPRA